MKFNTILAAKTDVTLFIGVVDERWYYDFSSVSTADLNKIYNIYVYCLCCWCIAHNIKECYITIIPVYQSR
jgi:hypothetical protein